MASSIGHRDSDRWDATLSPCENVRRSCAALMEGRAPAPADADVEDAAGDAGDRGGTGEEASVSIDHARLESLAAQMIASSPSSSSDDNGPGGGGPPSDDSPTTTTVQWDEEGWHYAADSSDCREHLTEEERCERVALYVLALDAINFCFWPTPGLEYEQLAVALRRVAEGDEGDLLGNGRRAAAALSSDGCAVDDIMNPPHDGDFWDYALSPRRLADLTPRTFGEMFRPHLPGGIVGLPNLSERCRLLNEVGLGLLRRHDGSAMAMIREADRSAERLVGVILETFPGFRDAAVDAAGRQVFFYKRAQIAVADLWGALGCLSRGGAGDDSSAKKFAAECCAFRDIDRLTTFADYRVPQLLRHEGVLVYNESLSRRVDERVVLMAGCTDELCIRAGTVVAVDRLVALMNSEAARRRSTQSASNRAKHDNRETANAVESQRGEVNAVRMDWLLWQRGEKLEMNGEMLPHHRVRTIFY